VKRQAWLPLWQRQPSSFLPDLKRLVDAFVNDTWAQSVALNLFPVTNRAQTQSKVLGNAQLLALAASFSGSPVLYNTTVTYILERYKQDTRACRAFVWTCWRCCRSRARLRCVTPSPVRLCLCLSLCVCVCVCVCVCLCLT
jgi:hypothetical protein